MKSIKHQQAFSRGMMAERISLVLLWFKGYKILAHRFRTPVGEIDIIALKKDTLIAIEVKSRSTQTAALESITNRQCQRIERTLEWFMVKNTKHAGHQLRFDIMLVSQWQIYHLKNAWWATTK